MHPYIVTGPETMPVVVQLYAPMSLSYLARRSITCDPIALADLNKRTFGCTITQAWPAFEHDVLVALMQGGYDSTRVILNQEAVAGLAAAILSRRDVPTRKAGSPLNDLLSSGRNGGRTSGVMDVEEVAKPAAPKRVAKAPPKKSALQSLLS